MKNNKGIIFIISAPSGAGKTTLCKIVCKKIPYLVYSVSYTTRVPRCGETEGLDYYFISSSQFKRKIREGKWAEWAEVHGNLYGTPTNFLEQNLKRGKNILLDVNIDGAKSISSKYPNSVTVFLMPTSLEVLGERLKNRGTDDILSIRKRLSNAKIEMEKRKFFKHVIVNHNLQESVNELVSILESNIFAHE